jgi:predicted secreted hydrolase
VNPILLQRRRLLAASLLGGLGMQPSLAGHALPLAFPQDAGAHPDFATEWWYVTGYANSAGMEAAFGFQITFFRSRIAKTQAMQSRLAARQLLFAHAAVTDIQGRTFWHDQRVARSSGARSGTNPLDTAWADTGDTAVALHGWFLKRQGSDLQAHVHGADFSLDLTLKASQPLLLQGEQGLSRKGPRADATSYYYSLPHLQVQGDLLLRGQHHAVGAGSTAWLDHEWSQAYMPPAAVGWDWIGINLFDGSALMAFRMRDKTGAALWDGGAFRAQGATTTNFQHGEVEFKPLRLWKSPASQTSYPVEWLVRTPTGSYTVRALLDAQEMDSLTSTGSVYWEGLCEVLDSKRKRVGRGYLEMTGYASPLQM